MSELIKKFQSDNGLVADGIIGKMTLMKIKDIFNINSIEHLSHFMGQTHHESGGFDFLVENTNYSAERLLKVFPNYFKSNAKALAYNRQPKKIAAYVYANRMGNGNEESGEGYIYRGRGILQLTGKNNYKLFADYLKKPEILIEPDLVANKYAFESALFYFDRNQLWDICNVVTDASIEKLTRRVNGGLNGLEDRKKLTKMYYALLMKK